MDAHHITGPPSPPVNLQVFVNSTADGGVEVQWDSPLDDGGAPIISYQVKVNEKNSSTREQTITINSTNSSGIPMCLVEVRAVNCAGHSNATSNYNN